MIRIVWEVPPALWEQLLDECAPITRGRGILALRLIEELRVLQLEPSAFPSDASSRNPLHFDGVEGRRIRRENYLKYTTNYLQPP